jgi:hypothetical protein
MPKGSSRVTLEGQSLRVYRRRAFCTRRPFSLYHQLLLLLSSELEDESSELEESELSDESLEDSISLRSSSLGLSPLLEWLA